MIIINSSPLIFSLIEFNPPPYQYSHISLGYCNYCDNFFHVYAKNGCSITIIKGNCPNCSKEFKIEIIIL